MSREELYDLRGRTLQVYLLLLRKGKPLGVREVQRELGFSSPSIAHHHLEKLKDMKIVVKDEFGRYSVSEKVDVGVLKMFIIVGGRFLPRFLFYAVFFTSLTLLYVLNHYPNLDVYALTFSSASMIISWYETVKIWRRREW
ncbi:MAG: hypothetical protein LZ172_03795 [Thaumarchaeota archaeon]|jgi:hypothetical protein|nr:hypothetical protein [Candidatus Geocrenenecus arthurdayi]MCL7389732.1 hypothetical protein [Candidatus Geocrenenecus arthurdayi]MCL7391078.1 hypothetical protein [Candidatus Geocrenenecus arthurdayi]MCL7396914.1 hypothetical protein [Candidatus Geocrenenecus arthurdayi]MCL7402209.1 hypothetical protein [Candidatus Geocrenenecus arthurdayi]